MRSGLTISSKCWDLRSAGPICQTSSQADSRNGHEIIKLLKESNKKYGQTLLLVTHDENIALQADRIIGISDGRVVRDERVVRR